MNLKTIAAIALGIAALGATATDALAWGGSGSHDGTFTYGGGSFSGSADGASFSGTYTGGTGASGAGTGSATLSATEPLSAFAVGLGLLGASFLRRRK